MGLEKDRQTTQERHFAIRSIRAHSSKGECGRRCFGKGAPCFLNDIGFTANNAKIYFVVVDALAPTLFGAPTDQAFLAGAQRSWRLLFAYLYY